MGLVSRCPLSIRVGPSGLPFNRQKRLGTIRDFRFDHEIGKHRSLESTHYKLGNSTLIAGWIDAGSGNQFASELKQVIPMGVKVLYNGNDVFFHIPSFIGPANFNAKRIKALKVP